MTMEIAFGVVSEPTTGGTFVAEWETALLELHRLASRTDTTRETCICRYYSSRACRTDGVATEEHAVANAEQRCG